MMDQDKLKEIAEDFEKLQERYMRVNRSNISAEQLHELLESIRSWSTIVSLDLDEAAHR